MNISLITDEISADPETAIELGCQWGIRDYEIRGFYTDRVPRFSTYQKQRLRDVLDDYGARVVAIGPGLFKGAWPALQAPRSSLGWMDRAGYDGWAEAQRLVHVHLHELLPASLDYANELGAKLVVVFSFERAGPALPPDGVLNCLRLAAERAAAAGLELVVETEDGFWADTGAHTAELMRAVNHPALRVNWDPANSFCARDEPYPAGYAAVRGWVRHVHFKDARRNSAGQAEYVARGQIDWTGQIQALAADGYQGHISIETHLRPKLAEARSALQRLQALLDSTAGVTAIPRQGG